MNNLDHIPSNKAKSKGGTHWLVLSYSLLLMFANSIVIIMSIAVFSLGKQHHIEAPELTLNSAIAFSSLNIICLIALIRKKKWGFWGYALSTIGATIFSMYYLHSDLKNAILSVLGILILYGVLRLGGKRNAWSQLR